MTSVDHQPGVPDADGQHSTAALTAGAVLPLGTAVPGEIRSDVLTARTYAHPALGKTVVVRLVGETVAPASDAALAFLKFGAPSTTEPVGVGRRHGLGFPDWVLVHDPDLAREALAAAPDMARAARLMGRKPGFARDVVESCARRFERHPHVLPSLYEQAARAFLAAGSPTHAAGMFEKARQVEQVHALAVDEDARQEAFLEFAFAGAISAKTLAAYARQLSKEYPAATAYARFRELCLRRTLGGMPPWAEMATLLSRMARAAKLDGDAEDDAVLTGLLEAQSLVNAPATFWMTYRTALARLARRVPAVLGRVVEMWPTGDGAQGFTTWWLTLLEECDAVSAIVALPPGRPAEWLSRLTARVTSEYQYSDNEPPPQVPTMIAALAERLRADGTPVRAGSRNVDPVLLDCLLANEIPVAPPEWKSQLLSLNRWSALDPETRCDLAAVAADAHWSARLTGAVGEYSNAGKPVDDLLAGSDHVREAVGGWLRSTIAGLGGQGIAQLASGLKRLRAATTTDTFEAFPWAFDALVDVDPAEVLARNLRLGLLSELSWPALEAAQDKLTGTPVMVCAWPDILVYDQTKAFLVSPDGTMVEYDFQPLDTEWPFVIPVDGRLLVQGWVNGETRAYWSNRPDEVFAMRRDNWGGYSIALPDGSRTAGGRALSVGDRTLPSGHHRVFSDGTTHWRLEAQWAQGGRTSWLVEFDPRTGATGRRSLPAFLEEWAIDGAKLLLEECFLAPSASGDLVGIRVRERTAQDGKRIVDIESTTGLRFTGRPSAVPSGFVAIPGGEGARPLVMNWRDLAILDPTGTFHVDDKSGLPVVPPPPYWIGFTPRDEKCSQALRQITRDQARVLLDAAVEDPAAPSEHRSTTATALDRVLGHAPTGPLRSRLIELLRETAEVRGVLDEMRTTRRPGDPTAREIRSLTRRAEAIRDSTVDSALSGLRIAEGASGDRCSAVAMVDTAAFFDGTTDSAPRDFDAPICWPRLFAFWRATAFRAASPLVDDDERETLLGLLELWSHTPFAADPLRYRVGRLTVPSRRPPHLFNQQIKPVQGCVPARYALLPFGASAYHAKWFLLAEREAAEANVSVPGPDGKKAAIEWLNWHECWPTAEGARRFVALVRERGPIGWDAAVLAEFSRRTGATRAEAALVCAGLPIQSGWRGGLTTDTRKALGLSKAEVDAALNTLDRPAVNKPVLIGAMVPDGFEALWAPLGNGPDDSDAPVTRVADEFVKQIGARATIPDSTVELAASLVKDLSQPVLDLLQLIADPDRVEIKNVDAPLRLVPGDREAGSLDTARARGALLADLVHLLVWAYTELPAGDPVRTGLPRVVDMLRRWLADPALLVHLATHHSYQDRDDVTRLTPFGPTEFTPSVGQSPPPGHSRDNGEIVAVVDDYALHLYCRPAAISGDAPGGPVSSSNDYTGLEHERTPTVLWAVDAVNGDVLSAMTARVRLDASDGGLPTGGYEANPALSAPDLVSAVAAERRLSAEAATLYLQLLTLAAPTDRNINTWNGWTTARRRRAEEELTAVDLVLRAKRSRAGRAVFIPGGWTTTAAPLLPLETWKLPLYEVTDARRQARLGRLLPPAPLPDLFAAAWKRILDGDTP